MKMILPRLSALFALLFASSAALAAAPTYTLSLVPVGGGTARGGGKYAAGRKVTVSATATKTVAFAGWYEDQGLSVPLATEKDYRTASVPYVMPDADSTLYARFIPLAEDVASVSAATAPEYATGAEIEPILLSIDSQSLPTVKVAGLPTGLKFTAAPLTVKATKTTPARTYAANTIYGTPTKSGVYVTTVTVTTAGRNVTTLPLKFIVRKTGETVFDIAYDALRGKATGAGVYAAGKSVSLRATASKGFVFAGWYADADYATPLAADADYRSTSVKYVVPDGDSTLYARFIPFAEDVASVSATPDAEYATGAEIDPLAVAVESPSLPTVKVAGLPAGLKFTAKPLTVKATKTTPARTYAANTIYGTPTKSGVYVATVTATTAGRNVATLPLKFIVRRTGETVFDVVYDASRGKATGAGVYAAGKSVSLRATASKGFVFAGWYADADCATPLSGAADYRTASFAYAAPVADSAVYARFIPADEDALELDFAPTYAYADILAACAGSGGFAVPVKSASLPAVTLSGLPAGLKYNAKTLSIQLASSTTVPKPGVYTVGVKATNSTVKKAVTGSFSVTVENQTAANHLFRDAIRNGQGESYAATVGVRVGDDLPSLALLDASQTLKVSGLPPGVTYDAASARLAGTPTRAGSYTVTLAAGGLVSSFSLVVEPVPDWLVGDYGFRLGVGRVSSSTNRLWVMWHDMSVTSAGKVSGRARSMNGVAASGWTGRLSSRAGAGGERRFVVECDIVGGDGEPYVLEIFADPVTIDGRTVGMLSGGFTGEDDDIGFGPVSGEGVETGTVSGGARVWSKAAGTALAPSFEAGAGDVAVSLSAPRAKVWRDNGVDFEYEGKLHLSFAAGGTVYYSYENGDGVLTGVRTASLALASAGTLFDDSLAWRFAVDCAPAGRAPFIAVLELSSPSGKAVLGKDDFSVSVVEISAADYDPFGGWAYGSFTGFHWLHGFTDTGNSGYFELCTLSVRPDGWFSLVGSALAGAEYVSQVYTTANASLLGEEERVLDAFRGYALREYETNVVDAVRRRAAVGVSDIGVYTGVGKGRNADGKVYDSDMFFVTTLWDDAGASESLPAFSSSNRTAYCEFPIGDLEGALGYHAILARLDFAAAGSVSATYYGIGYGGYLDGTNYVTALTTNILTSAKVFPTAEDRDKGRSRSAGGVRQSRILCYEADDGAASGWRAYLFLDGLAKGIGGTVYRKNAVFFSAALDLEIPVGADGLADAANISVTVLDPSALVAEGERRPGAILIHEADLAE